MAKALYGIINEKFLCQTIQWQGSCTCKSLTQKKISKVKQRNGFFCTHTIGSFDAVDRNANIKAKTNGSDEEESNWTKKTDKKENFNANESNIYNAEQENKVWCKQNVMK